MDDTKLNIRVVLRLITEQLCGKRLQEAVFEERLMQLLQYDGTISCNSEKQEKVSD